MKNDSREDSRLIEELRGLKLETFQAFHAREMHTCLSGQPSSPTAMPFQRHCLQRPVEQSAQAQRIPPKRIPFTSEKLKSELSRIRKLADNLCPTTFAASTWLHNERSCPLSSIRVAGIDRDIPIPISKDDMTLLQEKAELGFECQGLTNESVHGGVWHVDGRNVWSETQPSFFQRTVQSMVLQALESQMDVHATLNEMVLYEEGDHSLPRRNTANAPGVFGTYLLQLPVEGGHEGAELCIRHQGELVTIDTSTHSTGAAFQEVVFYADCKHERTTVTRGRRCVLAFHLSWRAKMVHDEGIKKRTLPMSILAGLPASQALPLSKLVERTHELIDRWTECSSRFDKRLAQAFSAVPSSKLAMYLVQENFNFYVQDGKYCPGHGDEDEETYEGDDSKERLEKMSCLHLEMLQREGEVVSFLSFDAAMEMHTLLNSVGNGP
eukprot:gene17402-12438_t